MLIPLPDTDFDPTESAVPWSVLTGAGHRVEFATERGEAPACDPLLIEGVLFGKLGAGAEAKRLYAEMREEEGFRSPLAWGDVDPGSYDALVLPGGHAPGMRPYLESETLREKVLALWRSGRPVGAICHGVLVLARTVDPETGRSVLFDKRTTALPKYLEAAAWAATAWKLGRYYRTYDTYVEDEVKGALAGRRQFLLGPLILEGPDALKDDGRGFAVTDGSYVSARWPGDAYAFARALLAQLEGR